MSRAPDKQAFELTKDGYLRFYMGRTEVVYYPDKDTTNAICINDKGGYQFSLYPGGEENPPICTMDGIPMYKWDGSQVVPRTETEIEADRAAIPEPPPSAQEQLRADVDFLSAMMGVML